MFSLVHFFARAKKELAAGQPRPITLRNVGYRLAYEVRDGELVVVVVAVGKRDRNAVYKLAAKR